MWMNLWEEVDSTGKEAGVLRVDDSNDRGSSKDGTREAVKVPKVHQGHSADLICALLGAYQCLANHRPSCCDFIRRVTLDGRDDTHKAKPHG